MVLGRIADSILASLWPGMPPGIDLGKTPISSWEAFINNHFSIMAHYWAIVLTTLVLFSTALFLPIGAYLLWRLRPSWFSASFGSNNKKKKIIEASSLLCLVIIALFLINSWVTNNKNEEDVVKTKQAISKLAEETGKIIEKTHEEFSTLFSFLLLRHKEIPLEALHDSVRLIESNLMELAADVDMNEFKDVAENQKKISRALTKFNGEARTISGYRAELETVLAELEDISALCSNCSFCPSQTFFHVYVDFAKIPAYIQAFIDIHNMMVRSKTTLWLWDRYGIKKTSQYLSNVLSEAELNLTEMIPSIESQWKINNQILSEKINRARQKQMEGLEQFSNPILQWLDVNYTMFRKVITTLLLAAVVCYAIGMIIIYLKKKLNGWLHCGWFARIASSWRKIYIVVTIPLISVSLAIIGVHVVASTVSHNTVCDDVGPLPLADGLEIGDFELEFNDICSSLAQNLREKLATIEIDTYDYRWGNEDKHIFWKLATSDWYLKIVELNVKFQNENSLMAMKSSDPRECWAQGLLLLDGVELQEKDENVSSGPKISDHDLLTYSLLIQEFMAIGHSSETLRNLSFNPPFWERQVDFLIKQTDKVVSFQQQSPNVLRELSSTFERKCKFLFGDLNRDAAEKVSLTNTFESVSSLRAAPKELYCNDVYSGSNEFAMSLMLAIIFILPSLVAALLRTELLENETPRETPNAQTNAVEESSL